MKKTIINKAFAFASSALLASCFVACSPDVEDTTANYAEKEKEVTSTTDTDSHTAKGAVRSWDVSVSPTSIPTASKDTRIDVSIFSYAKIDLETLEKALNFYTLKDNSENKYYYPTRSATPLSKSLLYTDEPSSYINGGGLTVFTFSVDTSSVETRKIAFVVDATQLKDKSGNAVLNLDEDDVAGEETDSCIKYITVSCKSDGETETTALNNRFDESFKNRYLETTIPFDLLDTDGNLTGKIRFTVDAPKKSVSFDEYGVPTWTYDDSVASTLNSIYKLKTKAPEATSWTDVALSFTYHADSDAVGTVNGVTAHTYTADTDALPYGTQWILVRNNITSGSAPSDYAKYYGHAGYFFYCGSKEFTEVEHDGISTVFIKSPANIYDFGTTEAASTDFNATEYTYEDAFLAQNDLLSLNKVDDGEWWVSLNDGEFESADDFIVTNASNVKVESTPKAVKDGDNKIIGVRIELKNKNVGGNYKVWVGNGTKLKSNPSYPTQKQFGVPADSSKGDVSGYVELANGGVRDVATSASSAISDYVVTCVNGTDYTDYYYWLDAGSTYCIQLANGYTSSYLLTGVDYTPACYYGSVKVTSFDESSTKLRESYFSSSNYFSVSTSGIYKVRVRRQYSSDSEGSDTNVKYNYGYVGFHIYEY